jgi:hypothetical protein
MSFRGALATKNLEYIHIYVSEILRFAQNDTSILNNYSAYIASISAA